MKGSHCKLYSAQKCIVQSSDLQSKHSHTPHPCKRWGTWREMTNVYSQRHLGVGVVDLSMSQGRKEEKKEQRALQLSYYLCPGLESGFQVTSKSSQPPEHTQEASRTMRTWSTCIGASVLVPENVYSLSPTPTSMRNGNYSNTWQGEQPDTPTES